MERLDQGRPAAAAARPWRAPRLPSWRRVSRRTRPCQLLPQRRTIPGGRPGVTPRKQGRCRRARPVRHSLPPPVEYRSRRRSLGASLSRAATATTSNSRLPAPGRSHLGAMRAAPRIPMRIFFMADSKCRVAMLLPAAHDSTFRFPTFPSAIAAARSRWTICRCPFAPGDFFGFLDRTARANRRPSIASPGIATPSAGTIEVFGIDAVKDYREARRLIGLSRGVQRRSLRHARQIVDWMGGLFRPARRPTQEAHDELMERFDFIEHQNKPFRELSGGLKRRVILARPDPRSQAADPRTSRPRASMSSCAATCGAIFRNSTATAPRSCSPRTIWRRWSGCAAPSHRRQGKISRQAPERNSSRMAWRPPISRPQARSQTTLRGRHEPHRGRPAPAHGHQLDRACDDHQARMARVWRVPIQAFLRRGFSALLFIFIFGFVVGGRIRLIGGYHTSPSCCPVW